MKDDKQRASRRTPALYADPALYELIHAEGTSDEVWLLDRLAARHGSGGKKALEPACGSGRYLAGLLRRGWTVTGYDRSPRMVAYARQRLSRWGARAAVQRGDMTTFRAPASTDLVFNLISTFRHLLTEREALAHLRGCGQALRPGGVFILGLDLAVYGEDEPDEELWTADRGGRKVRHVVLTLPPERELRRERIINFVVFEDGGRERVLKSTYDLRSYDARELRDILERAELRIEAVYGLDGLPAEIGGTERALWLVLKAAAG